MYLGVFVNNSCRDKEFSVGLTLFNHLIRLNKTIWDAHSKKGITFCTLIAI